MSSTGGTYAHSGTGAGTTYSGSTSRSTQATGGSDGLKRRRAARALGFDADALQRQAKRRQEEEDEVADTCSRTAQRRLRQWMGAEPGDSWASAFVSALKGAFAYDWVRTYNMRTAFGDLVGGLTVGVMLIPQGLAYAQLAGLPAVYGMYTAIFPGLIYSLFGSVPIMSFGPFALLSLLVAEAANNVSGESGGEDASDKYLAVVMGLAFFTGIIQIAMSLMKLGFVTLFLSPIFISGFTCSSAVLIGTSQLKHLVRLAPPRYSGLFQPFRTWYYLLSHIDEVHPGTIIFSVAAISMLLIIRWINGRFEKRLPVPLPGEFIVLALGIIVSVATDGESWGLDTVGDIKAGLPTPEAPEFSMFDIGAVITESIVLAVIGFAVSISIGKTFERPLGMKVSANAELWAMGIGNTLGAFFLSYPCAGSLSRSVVNAEAGGRHAPNMWYSAILVAVALQWATALFEPAPQPVLGAIIVVALKRLLLQITHVPRYWRIKRAEAFVWMWSFAVVLVFGVTTGLLLGVAGSIASMLYRQMRPFASELGRLPGTRVYRSVDEWDEARLIPGVRIIGYSADPFFANRQHLRDTVLAYAGLDSVCRPLEGTHAPRFVILDCSMFGDLDLAAVDTLTRLSSDLADQGISLLLAATRKRVRSMLLRGGYLSSPAEAPASSDSPSFTDSTARTSEGIDVTVDEEHAMPAVAVTRLVFSTTHHAVHYARAHMPEFTSDSSLDLSLASSSSSASTTATTATATATTATATTATAASSSSLSHDS